MVCDSRFCNLFSRPLRSGQDDVYYLLNVTKHSSSKAQRSGLQRIVFVCMR